MATSPPAPTAEKQVYEFGGFRVDPVRRRLLRGGEQVSLTPKAFSILLVLLENRGEVVGKEELIQKVWPDAFVTEANLTQNVSSLRKALGERANDHRYVVTVPGRGYSFVADVLEVPRESTGEITITHEIAITREIAIPREPPVPDEPPAPVPAEPALLQQAASEVPVSLPGPQPRGRRRFLAAGLILGFLLAVLAIGGVLSYKGRNNFQGREGEAGTATGTIPARPTVAVLGFRNLDGDRGQDWLSTALSEMLITELSAGAKVRMVPGEEVVRVRRALSLPYTENPDDETLQRIHALLGADLVVVGSYLSLADQGGRRLRIDLRVVRVAEGETVASFAEMGKEEGLFDLVSRSGRRLRHALGWAEPSPAEARAAAALQPGNPQAARLYAEGLNRLRAFDPRGARDLLAQAAEVSPDSAAVRSALSLAWIGLGDDARARAEAERAVHLSAALPRQERLAIEARAAEAGKDWTRASALYRSLWTFYPGDLEYGLRLAGCLSAAGRNPEALGVVAEMRKLPPPAGGDPRIDLIESQIDKRLSSFPAEMRAAGLAEEKGRASGETQVVAQALMLQGDGLLLAGHTNEAIPRFEASRDLFAKAGNQSSLALVLTHLGVALREEGHLAEGQAMSEASLATLRRLGSLQSGAIQLANLGLVAQDLGDLPRAQSLLEQAYAAFTAEGDRVLAESVLGAVGTVLLARGDLAGARQRFDAMLATSRQTENRVDEGLALSYQGLVLARLGSLGEARSLQEQAYAITQQVGDPISGAAMLAAAAEVLMRLGDLPEAERRLALALQMKRQGDSRLGIGQVLGLQAELQERLGNLAEAKRLTAEQEAIAHASGSRSLLASVLQAGSRWSLDEGDLPGARRRIEESLRLRLAGGEELEAASARLDLARLTAIEGNPGESARLASEVAGWYHQRGMEGFRARALARLAQALLAAGRNAPARQAADQAETIAEAGEDLDLRLVVAIAVAPVRAATGDAAAALDLLQGAIRDSARLGAVALELEARLELGLLQRQTGDPAAASSTLEEVQRTAQAKGFRAFAQRAAAGPQVRLKRPSG
jgi:DNA-binding winged helix-turn-helix (wHTH) protein/TolB-like protein